MLCASLSHGVGVEALVWVGFDWDSIFLADQKVATSNYWGWRLFVLIFPV